MGQFALILSISGLLLAGVLLYNGQMRTSEAQSVADEYSVDRLAREAAQVGLRQVVGRLNAEIDQWSSDLAVAQARFNIPPTDYQGATYRVVIDNMTLGATPADPDRVWATVTASYDSWNSGAQAVGATDFIINAVYEKGLRDIGVPPGMRNAVQTDEDLDIRGNACVSGGVHANGDLATSGGAFRILGEGTYTTTQSSNHSQYFSGGIAQSDSVYIPLVPIPPAAYTHTITPPTGTYVLNASTDPATTLADGWHGHTGYGVQGDPYVLYINGNLSISGEVRLIGYSAIYVSGSVSIGGNSTLSPVPASAGLPEVTSNMTCEQKMAAIASWVNQHMPNGSQIGIYAGGNITMGGNTNMVAHLTTNSSFTYTGGGNTNRLVIGGITAQNELEMSGNVMVHYTESSVDIEVPGDDRMVPEGLRLVAYREWAERP